MVIFFVFSGAQVAVASLVVNFLTEQGLGLSQSTASLMFSFCQLTFTVGRYVDPYYVPR